MTTLKLSHLDAKGEARMVDVSTKLITEREAAASCQVRMKPETFQLLKQGLLKKGDAFMLAKVAGVFAAKRTADLIPLCHSLPVEMIQLNFSELQNKEGYYIESRVMAHAKTGVEMEALTAVTIAALTIYDMAKSHDPGIRITDVHLVWKKGGKSGTSGWDNHSQ